ncbi:MAG: putative secondary metabolism biosynthetic enzyme [Peltula sp. TS41687]|nr:MAG: putative secondary metabolism biosynthetic enzyme [Peltula sp. TS41687]
MATPIADHTGWQITPTLHKAPNATTDPSNVTLPPSFTVCILGASRGIGAHVAYAYAQAGASAIVLAGRDTKALEDVAAQSRRVATAVDMQALTTVCDVASNESVSTLAEKVKTELGGLDVLVINAGLWGDTVLRVTDGTTKQFREIVDVDLVGAYLASHYFVPLLLAKESGAKAVIAISGTGAWVVDGPVKHTAHCVSKLAQARLMEHMAYEYREEGLLAVAVHPGCVVTDTSLSSPAEFHQYLTDAPDLCGGFLVWLTKTREDRLWMGGRFLSATWDADELLSMKAAIVEKDMLKARMVVS